MANRRFTAEEAKERKNQRQRNYASQREYNKQHRLQSKNLSN